MSFSKRRRINLRKRFLTAEVLEKKWLLTALTWNAGGDGISFSDRFNWSPPQIPGPADDLTIDSAAFAVQPAMVRVDSTVTVNSITLQDMAFTGLEFEVSPLGSLTVTQNDPSDPNGGTFSLLEGMSMVVSNTGGFLGADQMVSLPLLGGSEFRNSGISAFGALGFFGEVFVNEGFVQAGQADIVIEPFSGPGEFENTGQLFFDGGGGIGSLSLGSLSNAGEVHVGSGTFRIAPSGQFDPSTGQIFAANTAELIIEPGDLSNLVTNNTLLAGDYTLSNDATIQFGFGTQLQTIEKIRASVLLSENASFTGLQLDELLPSGSLSILNGNDLQQSFTSNGELVVAANSSITVPAGESFSVAGGQATINGSLTSDQPITVAGGLLEGTGTINGDVHNEATIAPGNSPGFLDIIGNYTQTSTGELQIEIAGRESGNEEFDRLRVTGDAILDGTLSVSFLDGFEPSLGDEFPIVNANTRTGEFAIENFESPGGGGRELSAVYDNTSVVLTAGVVPPLIFGHATTQQLSLAPGDEVEPQAVAFDDLGNKYVTGRFLGEIDFDVEGGSTGITTLSSINGADGFLAKYDPQGELDWVYRIDGSSDAVGYDLDVRPSGFSAPGVFVTGSFSGAQVEYDDGFGQTAAGTGTTSAFVLHVDPDTGEAVDIKSISGSATAIGRSIRARANSNEVFVVGEFTGTADADPGISVENLTSAGGLDAFAVLLSTESGLIEYAHGERLGGAETDRATAVDVDGNGNYWVGGEFRGTANGMANLASNGETDAFLLKLGPISGVFFTSLSQSYGGPADDAATSLVTTSDNSVVLAGNFEFSVDFDIRPDQNFTLHSGGDEDAFFLKVNNSGVFQWADAIGGFRRDLVRDIAIDADDSVYATGEFTDVVDFDPNDGRAFQDATPSTSIHAYLVKLDSDGEYVWSAELADQLNAFSSGYGIDVTDTGGLTTVGQFTETVDFDPTDEEALRFFPPSIATDVAGYIASYQQKVIPEAAILGLPSPNNSNLETGGFVQPPPGFSEGESMLLAASVTDADSTFFSYDWTVTQNGLTIATSDEATLSLFLEDEAMFEVDLVVVDESGNRATVNEFVFANDIAPMLNPVSFTTTGMAFLDAVEFPPNSTDRFGTAVAHRDDGFIVGAPDYDVPADYIGVAVGFDRTGALLGGFFADVGVHQLGSAIAVDGDTVAIGAPGAGAISAITSAEISTRGEVLIYENTPPANTGPTRILSAPFTGTSAPTFTDEFGASLAFAGNLLLIGAPNANGSGIGEVYLFDPAVDELVLTLANPTPEPGDRFGESVASVGEYLVVAAPGDDSAGLDAGAIYVFDPNTGELVTTLFDPAAGSSGEFGVSIDGTGHHLFVGDPASNSIHGYDLDPASLTFGLDFASLTPDPLVGNDMWVEFGTSVSVEGTRLLGGDPAYGDLTGGPRGAAALLDVERNSPTFGQTVATFGTTTAQAGDLYGAAVALSGDGVVVGAPNTFVVPPPLSDGTNSGIAEYHSGTEFVEILDASDPSLGTVASIDEGSTALLRASFNDPGIHDTHRGSTLGLEPNSETDVARGDRNFTVERTFDDDDPTATDGDILQFDFGVTDTKFFTGETVTLNLPINNVPPTVTIQSMGVASSSGVIAGEEYMFTAVVDDPGSDTFTYQWTVDGTVSATTGPELTVTLAEGEVPMISVTVTDDDLASTTVEAEVIVGTSAPETIVVDQPAANVDKVIVLGLGGNDKLDASNVDVSVELVGGDGDDTLMGGALDDLLVGNNPGDYEACRAALGEGDLGVATATCAVGDSSNDLLEGNAGNDTLDGGLGDDTSIGGEGDDTYFAVPGSDDELREDPTTNEGVDTIDYSRALYGITFNLYDEDVAQVVNPDAPAAEQDTVRFIGQFENLTGSEFADELEGNNESNDLKGGGGDDLLFGGDPTSPNDGSDTLDGGEGNDTISGGAGNDLIFGGDSPDGNDDDSLLGGEGNDTLDGGTGNDLIFGGDGSGNDEGEDTLLGGEGNDTLSGGDGNDLIFGGDDSGADPGTDSLIGGGGNDTLDGGGGNDLIFGGDGTGADPGEDSLIGGDGNDTISGGSGNDLIFGGSPFDDEQGDDSLIGGAGNDTLDGGAGNDLIFGGDGTGADPGEDSLLGGDGNDTIEGGAGNDLIFGGDGTGGDPGNDSLLGGAGNDTIEGGAGNDLIFGGDLDGVDPGEDSLLGGDGNDTLEGGAGNDLIFGGDPFDTVPGSNGGDDSIVGGAGNDTLDGGSGNDLIFGGSPSGLPPGTPDNDHIRAGLGDDTVEGGAGDDTILGGAGADVLTGNEGFDKFEGGSGADSISELSDPTNFVVTATQIIIDGVAEQFFDVEGAVLIGGPGDNLLDASEFPGPVRIVGGAGNDTLIGSDFDDVLDGGPGNDQLSGGDGNDVLDGGPGNDNVDGGNDNDTYVQQPGSADVFTDVQGIDSIDFSSANFAIELDLNLTTTQTVDSVGNQLTLNGVFENARGSSYDDEIVGNDERNIIEGGGGRDNLDGGGGDDTIQGGFPQVVYLDFDTATNPGEFQYDIPLRNEIQKNLEELFSDPFTRFSIDFTQNQPGVGRFSTIFINGGDSSSSELLVAGVAFELDWRNFNAASLATVNANALLDPDSDTTANFRSLTTTLIAHELAHLLGLRHSDSFGPIGINPATNLPYGIFDGLVARRRFEKVAGNADAADATITRYRLSEGPVLLASIQQQGNAADTPVVLPVGKIFSAGDEVAEFSVQADGTLNITATDATAPRSGTLDANQQTLELTWPAAPADTLIEIDYRFDSFRPGYRGPDDAFETPQHVSASPASVGSAIADALGEVYFGERELIKLSFADTGDSLQEPELPSVTSPFSALARDLGELTPLAVPNTLPSKAVNFGVDLNVSAENVVGEIVLDGTN